MYDTDTICAIATPPGEGGIGIVRLSGPQAVFLASQFFEGEDLKTARDRYLYFGKFRDPKTGKILDEVLCAVMRAPRSYTGEDMVEISAHGNPLLLAQMVQLLLKAGARLAERGEFTKRAFLNGKIDLTQAESVVDLVKAKTKAGIEAAVEQLQGKLGKYLKGIREEILSILSPIEAGIDFPEEEVPEVPHPALENQILQVLRKVEQILQNASNGRILREGMSAVIVGKPNVGKSSLLNALLREGRAIVTEIPGTTRDTLEEWADLHGIPVKFVDTAGIHSTDDKVEQIGIARAWEAMAKGDLLLLVLDRSRPLESEDFELLNWAQKKPSIAILNKMDLEGPLTVMEVKRYYEGPIVPLSILKNEGLELLQEKIVEKVRLEAFSPEIPLVTHLRHQEALERAYGFLSEALETVKKRFPLDLAVLDLRGASVAIGEITGEDYTEDLIQRIFSEFCIGK